MRRAIPALTFLFLIAASVSAFGGKPADRFDGEVVSVSVFKNGYGFFHLEGEAELRNGAAEISPVPAAALGTWWFYTRAEGARIEHAVAAQRDTEDVRVARSIDEILSANAGREAMIDTEKGKYVGVIIAPPPEDPPSAEELRLRSYRGMTPSDVILKTPDGVIVLRRSDIRAVTVTGGSEEYRRKGKEGYVTLKVKGAAAGKIPVGCQYLQKGIRWIPSYRLELVDDETASLALQAEVINDIRDLEGSTLQLVVGIPNFMWGEFLSPLAYVSEMPTLSEFFLPAGDRDSRNAGYFSNATMSQSAGRFRYDAEAEPLPGVLAVDESITSRDVSDLFYYTKRGVTLKSGERASLNLLSGEVPYRHIYKWDVPDQNLKYRIGYREIYDRWLRGDYARGRDVPQEVSERLKRMTRQNVAEHYVRLTNATGKPLTSGPTLLFDRGSVLAQDVARYTPAGATLDVRVTGAPDIKVSQEEKEISRQRKALVVRSTYYDLVFVETRLSVRNFKKEAVQMVVTKEFDGTIDDAPEDAKVTKDTGELVIVNPHTRAQWEFDLEPDEEREITLSYSTYICER